jgi:hypothetical protein
MAAVDGRFVHRLFSVKRRFTGIPCEGRGCAGLVGLRWMPTPTRRRVNRSRTTSTQQLRSTMASHRKRSTLHRLSVVCPRRTTTMASSARGGVMVFGQHPIHEIDEKGRLADPESGGSTGMAFGREGSRILVNGRERPTMRAAPASRCASALSMPRRAATSRWMQRTSLHDDRRRWRSAGRNGAERDAGDRPWRAG